MKEFLPLLSPTPSILLHSIPLWALKAKGNGICLDFLPNLCFPPPTEESLGSQGKKLWLLLNSRVACLFASERDAFHKGVRTRHCTWAVCMFRESTGCSCWLWWHGTCWQAGELSVSVKSCSPHYNPNVVMATIHLNRWHSSNHPCSEWLSVFPKVHWRLVLLQSIDWITIPGFTKELKPVI